METIARFEKVSLDEYLKANDVNEDTEQTIIDGLTQEWNDITLPTRATEGSAGFDFYAPYDIVYAKDVKPTFRITTGIRCYIEPGWFLMLVPRSGLGCKVGMRLKNTIGCVDSDYYTADNEGHIMAFIEADEDFYLEEGDRFMQGIFVPYGLAENCEPLKVKREGGFGSTGGN